MLGAERDTGGECSDFCSIEESGLSCKDYQGDSLLKLLNTKFWTKKPWTEYNREERALEKSITEHVAVAVWNKGLLGIS